MDALELNRIGTKIEGLLSQLAPHLERRVLAVPGGEHRVWPHERQQQSAQPAQ
jgi:hypothetical protein